MSSVDARRSKRGYPCSGSEGRLSPPGAPTLYEVIRGTFRVSTAGQGGTNRRIIWETTGRCLVEWDDGDEDFRGRGWRSFTKCRRSALRRQAGHGETMRRGAASRLRRQYILLHALYHQQPAVQVSEMNSGTVYFGRISKAKVYIFF